MHIFFSGIGGAAIGPLALIAKQAGYRVSGSDAQDSQYIEYLRSGGIKDIHIGQSREAIAAVHAEHPIDWYVRSSAITTDNPELAFCKSAGIKTSKRDELLNKIITDHKLKMTAIAGTHGKTTTTAMVIWLFKQLDQPCSHSVGAKLGFAEMGHFDPASQYFVYEADEFDRNFLAFKPHLSLITGLAWDHHEIFPKREDYNQAFRDFIGQSQWTILWASDAEQLTQPKTNNLSVLNYDNPSIDQLKLKGLYNRRDGWLAIQAVHKLTKQPVAKLVELMNGFSGLARRFEKITDNLYSDYAHTPHKILGAMHVAKEHAKPGQQIVVIYEPLTNRRMHYTAAEHRDVFEGAQQIYWVPSYLAREDPAQPVLTPTELIKHLNPALQKNAAPAELNDELFQKIKHHLAAGDLVVALSGGGGGSLDEWLRTHFAKP